MVALCVAGPPAARRAEALCADATGDGYVTATDALAALTMAISAAYDARADVALLEAPDGSVTASGRAGA